MIKSVLITGGSGLVGTALTNALLQKGYHVSHLGRNASMGKVKTYRWDPSKQYIDPEALAGVDAVIHLAGAGVADKRWTIARKKEILDSRTQSTQLLYRTLKAQTHQIKVVVSASAIGYYGISTSDNWCDESSPAGNDFLAHVCHAWESEADAMNTLKVRLVKIRVGVVLSDKGGALPQMANPVKWFLGAPLGSGQQWISWIHVQDLCNLFVHSIEQPEMKGVYNAVAPQPVKNNDFTHLLANVLQRPLWLPAVPAFALKLILGEMSQIVVSGARVSGSKTKSTGFHFLFTDVATALENLLRKE